MAEPIRTIVNFRESCLDPLAKLVLLEAMSYAVEKAESRLESLGKIFPGLESMGDPIIQDIKDIRFAVENLNVCSVPTIAPTSGPAPVASPPPSSTIKEFPKREQELIKQMPAELQAALVKELERQPGESVKETEARVKKEKVAAPAKEHPPEKERTLPTAWGSLEYKNQSYSSPGAFLRELHGGDVSKIRGKGNYLKQLEAEGFDVYIGDKLISPSLKKEEVEKLKGVGLRIQLKKGVIKPTPGGGKPVVKTAEAYLAPWTLVQNMEGNLLFIEDANKVPIPESVWKAFNSYELDRKAPNIRKTEEISPFPGIPGLPVRSGKVVIPKV